MIRREGNVRRVAMVSASFHPHIGGSERQALEVSRALIRRGVAVTVLTRRLPGLTSKEDLDGVEVLRLFRAGRGLLGSLTFLGSLFLHLVLQGRRYDAIHVHMASSPAVAAAWAGALRRLPVFIKVAGGAGVGEVAQSQESWAGRFKSTVLKQAKVQFLVVSPVQAAEIRLSGLCREPIELPNGVDLTSFSPGSDEREMGCLAGPDSCGQRPIFLAVMRLDEDKSQASALERFFEGWRTARQGGMEAELWIAGDGPAKERLCARVRELGLEDSVRWLGWVKDPLPLYRAADVFVLVSGAEGLSNAMLEAMACGLPVCAMRIPGVVERIQPDLHGLLFDPNEPLEAALALSMLASDSALRWRLGVACRQKVEAEFSIETTADRLLALYRGG